MNPFWLKNITRMHQYNSQLAEQLLIVEQLFISGNNSESTLVPDNKAEIFIPLDRNLEINLIGTARPILLEKEKSYFLSPRRRGLEILNDASYLLIKINPIYAMSMAQNLDAFVNGIYHLPMEISSQNDLIGLSDVSDIYSASDILSAYIDEDAYDYNFNVLDSIDRIKETSGTVLVKELYTSLNVSKSTLEQHFNREIGLTPKEFCRIEKINAFIQMYKHNMEQSLTELTYRCGYYDQSHLIKDFQYFLNTSPKRFLISNIDSRFSYA